MRPKNNDYPQHSGAKNPGMVWRPRDLVIGLHQVNEIQK